MLKGGLVPRRNYTIAEYYPYCPYRLRKRIPHLRARTATLLRNRPTWSRLSRILVCLRLFQQAALPPTCRVWNFPACTLCCACRLCGFPIISKILLLAYCRSNPVRPSCSPLRTCREGPREAEACFFGCAWKAFWAESKQCRCPHQIQRNFCEF